MARDEASKALKLFPYEPMAHAVLGATASAHYYDWREAQDHFGLARVSEPCPPPVHDLYALNYLLPLGRFQEALQERAKSIAQDPLNAVWRGRQAFTLLCAEKYESSIVEAIKALELDGSYLSRYTIALSNFCLGNLVAALESAEEAVRIAPWHPGSLGTLAGLMARSGEKNRSQKLAAALPGMMPIGMTMYHLICSEIEPATEWYQRYVERREFGATMYVSAGFLKPLRGSPRWPKLAKMMNLPGTT